MATAVTTKKRSTASRKPRADPRSLLDTHDFSPPSSDPSSENKQSPESEGFDATGKVFHLNTSSLKTSSINKIGGVAVSERKRDSKDGRDRDGNGGSKGGGSRSGEHGNTPSGSGEGKVRKLKLKLAGVTHTLHTNASAESAADSRPGSKNVHSSEAARYQKKLSVQGNSDEDSSRGRTTEENSSEPVRKSKRVPKKKVLDGAFDEDDDDEIRYLERLRNSKLSVQNIEEQEEDLLEASKNRKNGKASKIKRISYDVDEDYGSSRRSREGKKRLNSDIDSKDDNTEEEDPESDVGPESKKRKADVLDSDDGKKEFALTTRQRALQSSGGKGSSVIEFPDGLPPPPPRKQKEKLSEVEQQLKKAEAARRRRIQVEKAARESEAEAIRKILGQDSSRKKREDKLRKKREELERAANSMTLAPDFVRLVMGPTGTTVTFPEGVNLPSIFESKPCSYPPPREKCAGPSCPNTYKYRDSKSNLPLCSLECYRAVRQNAEQLTSC